MARVLGETEQRIEALLAELADSAEPGVAGRAEELVRLLMGLYGSGLERVLELVVEEAERSDGGRAVFKQIVDDRLLVSLLVLHDLHPLTLDQRVEAALEQVRPYLGSHAGGVTYLGVDDEGVAHVKLQGSCEGCASSTVTVAYAIETAILDAVPEVIRVEAEGVDMTVGGAQAGTSLHQIGSLGGTAAPSNGSAPVAERAWERVEGLHLLPGQTTALEVGGAALLVCSVEGNLYAYRNACAACGSRLEEGALAAGLLTCPACATAYDVRLAGRSANDEALHLEPVPLLPDHGAFKVAVPQGIHS